MLYAIKNKIAVGIQSVAGSAVVGFFPAVNGKIPSL